VRESHTVQCVEHGTRPATFVCQHLVTEFGAGFHWGTDPDEPDAWWPDAWCDDCERVLEQEGEWTPRALEAAGLRLLCDRCYEVARERNWNQDDEAFGALMRDALEYVRPRQEMLKTRFGLTHYERYDWNSETGRLVFSQDGRAQVIAEFQFAGTVSTKAGTWLWSWANPSIPEASKERIRAIREHGEDRGYLKLAAACWVADESDGWDMAALVTYLLRAQGIYRSPEDSGFSFLVLTDVQRVQ